MDTFIIDDEAPARRELRYLLEQIDGIRVVGEAPNGTLGIKGIRETKPNLVFLDIEMPGINGLQLSEFLRELPDKPLLIFATAFPQYATDAFDLEAFDYILKPYALERIKKTIIKAEGLLGTVSRDHYSRDIVNSLKPIPNTIMKIPLYYGERIIPVSSQKIIFAKCEGGEIFIQTTDEKFRSKLPMNELEQRLSKYGFMRVHRSYIVNLNHVLEIIPWFNGSYKLIMNDREKTEILVSRYNVKDLKKHFGL